MTAKYKVLTASKKGSIKDVVTSAGLPFHKGCGYYRLQKKETIQDYKKVVARRRKTDEFVDDGPALRKLLGIPSTSSDFEIDLDMIKDFDIFIQSAAPNRGVTAGDDILYELEGKVNPVAAPDPVVQAAPTNVSTRSKRSAPSSTAAPAAKIAKTEPAAEPAASVPAATRGKRSAAPSTALPVKQDPEPEAPKIEPAIKADPEAAPATATKPEAAPTAPFTGPVDVVLSFDATASMFPCLTQVRSNLASLISRLFASVPNIRIGVLAHGDYDTHAIYVTKGLDLTRDRAALLDFVSSAQGTPGWTIPECYELALHKARTDFSWDANAQKAFVMIGDSVAHEPHDNPDHLDWREECRQLRLNDIRVYAVQALNRPSSTSFWSSVAEISGGIHLHLSQFANIGEYITAICYRERSASDVEGYETQLRSEGRMNRALHAMFDSLLGRAPKVAEPRTDGLVPVNPARFQVLRVGDRMSIRDFAEHNGLVFKTGRGFYEFTKPEKISDAKEIVLVDKATGDMVTGAEAARIIGVGGNAKIAPATLEKWRVFVQSTSYNRFLVPDTGFLYEVDPDA